MKHFAFLSKLKEKLKPILKNKKITSILIVLLVILVVFYFIVSNFSFTDKEEKLNRKTEISVSDYSKSVENKLSEMLLQINELNKVSVMVMVESTPKIEYLTETEEVVETKENNSSSTKSTTIVFEKDGSVSTPIVVTTLMPKITGVLIITNKISVSTKLNITKSISIVLNIDESCISILQEI